MEKIAVLCKGLLLFMALFAARIEGAMAVWQRAHATFYGGSDASGTMGQFSF